MLQTKYKTNSLMRCKNLGFVIPLGSILALLLLLVSAVCLPFNDNNSSVAYATNGADGVDSDPNSGIMPLADSPSVSLSYSGSSELSGSGSVSDNESSAIVSMSSDITISTTLIDNYILQISGNPTLEGPSTINATTSTVSTAAELANDTWGYSWNNGSYKGISTSNVSIESASVGNTNNGTVSFTKPLTFAAKFSKDANAGHYKTKVNLLLTATPKTLTTYSITYNTNGGTGTPNPASQSINSYDDTYTFAAAAQGTLAKTGYTFLGWSESSTATTATYTAGANIALTKDSPSKTLYVVWGVQGAEWKNSDGTSLGINSGIQYMQDINIGIGTNGFCKSSLPNHASIILKDRRDESSYTIVKMADGRCWMMQNLKITGTIQATDSDFSSPASITLPNSISGYSDSTVYQLNAYITKNTGYYNWYTATAQAGNSNVTSGSVNTSICPKNWKLPSGGSDATNSDFGRFAAAENITNDTAGSAKIKAAPYNFTATGRISNGSMGDTSNGRWWTSTVLDSTYAYRLDIGSTYVGPGTSNDRRRLGFAVRCVADQLPKFSLTFDPGNDDHELRGYYLETFQKDFAAQTSPIGDDSDSYTFTIPNIKTAYGRYYDSSSFVMYSVQGWTTIKGSSTVQYTPGSTITLTSSNPILTLYPIWIVSGGGGSIS